MKINKKDNIIQAILYNKEENTYRNVLAKRVDSELTDPHAISNHWTLTFKDDNTSCDITTSALHNMIKDGKLINPVIIKDMINRR